MKRELATWANESADLPQSHTKYTIDLINNSNLLCPTHSSIVNWTSKIMCGYETCSVLFVQACDNAWKINEGPQELKCIFSVAPDLPLSRSLYLPIYLSFSRMNWKTRRSIHICIHNKHDIYQHEMMLKEVDPKIAWWHDEKRRTNLPR